MTTCGSSHNYGRPAQSSFTMISCAFGKNHGTLSCITIRHFAIQPQAIAKVTELCQSATNHPDAGNGRFCRNLVESAILAYAAKVYKDDNVTAEKDFTLLAEDFPVPDLLQEKQAMPIGFRM